MSKVSEHLFEHHKVMHKDRADAIANNQAALDKAAGMEPHTSFHKAEIARHTKALAHHAACMDECSKAAQSEDLEKLNSNRLVPTNVSVVVPDVPNVRAIPRFGSRPIPTETTPVEFAKIIGDGEEFMHVEEVSLQKHR